VFFLVRKINVKNNIPKQNLKILRSGCENWPRKPTIFELLRTVKPDNRIFFPWKKSNTQDDSGKLPLKKNKNNQPDSHIET
jgi:hypothetical protein